MDRPCPEYFNGVKYNTTRECPATLRRGLCARLPGERFREWGGPQTWRRRAAEGRGTVTLQALKTFYFGALPWSLPTVASDLGKTVFAHDSRGALRAQKGEKEIFPPFEN